MTTSHWAKCQSLSGASSKFRSTLNLAVHHMPPRHCISLSDT